jgi:hypothetical protein
MSSNAYALTASVHTLPTVDCRGAGQVGRGAARGARETVAVWRSGEVLIGARHVASLAFRQQATEGAVDVLEARGQRGHDVAR